MRLGLLAIGVYAFAGATSATPAAAGEPSPSSHGSVDCLSSGATLEAVSRKEAIAPQRAIGAARAAAPGAEVLRAALCRNGGELAYRVMALREDGRVVRVTIEAGSGKITAVH